MLNNKRLIFSFIYLFLVLTPVFSQNDGNDRPGKSRRFFFGGNFGLQVGSITNIEISPIAGYRVFPWFSVAAGPKYQLYGENYSGYKFSTHIYGGRTFARIMLVSDLDEFIPVGFHGGLFLHGEYEMLSLERQHFDLSGEEGRFWMKPVLAGGGISQPLSKRASANIMLLWNFNEPENTLSLYRNPILRFGINF